MNSKKVTVAALAVVVLMFFFLGMNAYLLISQTN